MLCAFLLGSALCATPACVFAILQLLNVAPSMRCLPHFDFEIRFTLQRRAIFHLSSPQLAPHPPLYRVYFRPFLEPQTLEKRNVARYFQLFARLHFFSDVSFWWCFFACSFLTLPTSAFHLSKLSKLLFGLRQNLYEEQLNQILGKWHTPRVCTQPPVVQCCLAVMNVGLEKCHV